MSEELGTEVRILGRLPWPEAMRELAGGRSVALAVLQDIPNYRHSLPTKVLEYVGMGIPVVASALPGTVAVLGGLEGVRLVQPSDVEAIAAALTELATPEERRRARLSADVVRREYGWPAADVLAFYEGLG